MNKSDHAGRARSLIDLSGRSGRGQRRSCSEGTENVAFYSDGLDFIAALLNSDSAPGPLRDGQLANFSQIDSWQSVLNVRAADAAALGGGGGWFAADDVSIPIGADEIVPADIRTLLSARIESPAAVQSQSGAIEGQRHDHDGEEQRSSRRLCLRSSHRD